MVGIAPSVSFRDNALCLFRGFPKFRSRSVISIEFAHIGGNGMFTKRVGFCCSCLLILLCICTSAAMGQSTGTVSGTVTDSSGGVVAGCTVYLKDAATGSARTRSEEHTSELQSPM